MLEHLNQEFFETVRDSLNRTRTYHKGALSKFKGKKPKQKDIEKFLKHRKGVDDCEKALEDVVKALYALR